MWFLIAYEIYVLMNFTLGTERGMAGIATLKGPSDRCKQKVDQYIFHCS